MLYGEEAVQKYIKMLILLKFSIQSFLPKKEKISNWLQPYNVVH